jgi:hypothetical protein
MGPQHEGGRVRFVYNVLGIHLFSSEATEPILAGKHQMRMEFSYDGRGLGKGGDVTLYCDGQAAGDGRVEITQPAIFAAGGTTDVAQDFGMPVARDCAREDSRFNGGIHVVQIDTGGDDPDHFINPMRSSASPCLASSPNTSTGFVGSRIPLCRSC